jgi:hypothetical protein
VTVPRVRPLTLAVAAIAALALTLRIIGLQYGLPAVYNADEVAIMARALSFAKGTLNPHNFLYPTFYFYVLFAWVGTYLGAVWLTGGVASVAALQQMYFTSPEGIYTAGRALSAVCGAAATLALFALGRRLFDARTGVVAALFLAVAPLAVRDAHYVKHDVPASLAVLVAMWAICRIWPAQPERANDHAVLWAAAACGLAFSTHYYCIFLALPLAWAIICRWQASGPAIVARHLVTAALISAVVFFALSPFLLVEPIVAWRDIVANRQIVVDRAVESGAFGSAARYVDILWHDSIGRLVLIAAVVGGLWLLWTDRARAVLVLLFPAAFLIFIANTAPGSRYLNPVLPVVALLAAWALARATAGLRWGTPVLAAAALLFAVSPLRASIAYDRFFRIDDTRTLARTFVEQTIPAGTTVLVQPYSVPLVPSRDSLVRALERHFQSAADASTKFRIQLSLDPYPSPAYDLLWLGRGGLDVDKIYLDPSDLAGPEGIATLRGLGVGYVILKAEGPGEEPLALAASLPAAADLVAEFSPFRSDLTAGERAGLPPFLHNSDARLHAGLARPGPVVQIWRLRAGAPAVQ